MGESLREDPIPKQVISLVTLTVEVSVIKVGNRHTIQNHTQNNCSGHYETANSCHKPKIKNEI